MSLKLNGALSAIITPMKNGKVSIKDLEDLVSWQIDQGINGFIACGTTGETPTLSKEEQNLVIRTVVEITNKRVPVIAGAGTNNTQAAIERSKEIAKMGVDGLLHVTPYYNKPPQRGLIAHFEAIANQSEVPIVLYNVPGRTGVRLDVSSVATLADHQNIVALKEAGGDIAIGQAMIAATKGKISILSGDDALCMALTCMGGDGVISVVSNVAPKLTAEMIKAAQDQDLKTARTIHYRLLDLIDMLFVEANPIPVKAAMAELGFGANEVRAPLTILAEKHHQKLIETMKKAEIKR